jgi:hypothetical protein
MEVMNTQKDDSIARRVRLAEITSGLGAGILGLGIGVVIAPYLTGLGLLVVAVGLVLHAWGMADKHRLEAKQGIPEVWWSTFFYWVCWVSLAAVTIYIIWQRF